MMVRMHHIQQLEKLNIYPKDELHNSSLNKLRKKFIKHYPNEYIHDIYKF